MSNGQTSVMHRDLKWKSPKNVSKSNKETQKLLSFEGADYEPKNKSLPSYSETFYFNRQGEDGSVELMNQKFETLAETNLIADKSLLSNEIKVVSNMVYFKKSSYISYTFIPIRKNPTTGTIERLVSFDLNVISKPMKVKKNLSSQTFASNSVLATGTWYKIGITSDGMYQLNYTFLKSLGIDVDHLHPKNIRIYGNGGAMLPFSNSVFRHDDLVENPIRVVAQSDTCFKQNDYVLFFGQGPNRWTRNTNPDSTCHPFIHLVNYYSDTTFYFINVDLGPGKRLVTNPSYAGSPNIIATTFNDYLYHEADSENLMKSGRQWYGEVFDILNSYTFGFYFPNIDASSPTSIFTDVVGNCASQTTTFTFNVNSNNLFSLNIPLNGATSEPPAGIEATGCTTFNNGGNPSLNINVSYSNPGNALGYLDYIELNTRRYLTLYGQQMLFRDLQSIGTGNITEFNVSNINSNIEIWDVTDPTNVFIQGLSSIIGSTLKFVIPTDTLHEFIAFNNSVTYPVPVFSEKIKNQNLHATAQKDYIIVTHPDFADEALRIANYRKTHDNLSYIVVTPQQIYNEFSSGKQDITAIRSFVKMFYDRAGHDSTKLPKYLLLFGDGSFDNKNRIANNTNYIPTFESLNSLSPTQSFVSDDFYGLLDDTEGFYDDGSDSGLPDIGIGRFPVDNLAQATAVVNKIIHYSSPPSNFNPISSCNVNSNSVYGDWRNQICFVAGDKESNTFVNDAENMYNQVTAAHPVYNINKIYLDAYKEENTPGGQRYPEVNKAITDQVEKGCLIMNYTGHGGQAGWGFERVLDISMVNSWNNYNNLVAFFTATCQYSEWDDPTMVSAGELSFLNTGGGAICLFTTVRLVYAGANSDLNRKFYDRVFTPINGKMPTIGTIMELIKMDGGSTNTNDRNFTLLGDPAMTLAYPNYNIVTTTINGNSVIPDQNNLFIPDTLKALEKVTITGYVSDQYHNKLSNFNGFVYPTVYDKPSTVYTLGNDAASPVLNFQLQQNVIYNGKSSVKNGEFSYSFILPKDIAFQYGRGKLSYYGYTTNTDANGYNKNIFIGGYDKNSKKDTVGPTVKLYMNDSKFIFGGATDANPIIYAVLKDSSGINTVGNGIGHDITAQLDNDNEKIYVLNDYYQADLDNYQSGTVFFPLTKLSNGRHSITFKVWDVYNNSSTAYVEFVVEESTNFQLDHVLNYPNPFTTHTEFFFEHNCSCENLNVLIQIYTVSGKLIKTINTDMHTEGYRSTGIAWDGKDDYNSPIGRGVYIYRMKDHRPGQCAG